MSATDNPHQSGLTPPSTLSARGEFGLIESWHKRLRQRAGVRLGIGDDAAVLDHLQVPIVTCDCLIEKVHFRRDWTTPRALGRKAIAVNVSDVAAMGGHPVAAFISIAIGPHDDAPFLEQLYAGFEDMAARYNLTIAGGDTARSPAELMLSVTIVGAAPVPVLRSGAQVGDLLLVTGTLGDAAAGLALLQATPAQNAALGLTDDVRDYLLQRHHEPTPRLLEMQAALACSGAGLGNSAVLGAIPITAALDISDGLAGDAAHIAARSGVTLEIEVERLPITPFCREAATALGVDALDWALRGGEDYELLWCVAPAAAAGVMARVEQATGTPVTVIGRCREAEADAVTLLYPNGKRERAGRAFSHF